MSTHMVLGYRVIFNDNYKVSWKKKVLRRIEEDGPEIMRGYTNPSCHCYRARRGRHALLYTGEVGNCVKPARPEELFPCESENDYIGLSWKGLEEAV